MRPSRSFATYAFAAIALALSFGGIGWGYAIAAEADAAAVREQDQNQRSDDLGKLHDAVVEAIEKNFFDEALLRQVDWRARATAVRPSVVSAATTEEAVRRINALLAELKTSHTALFGPDDYE